MEALPRLKSKTKANWSNLERNSKGNRRCIRKWIEFEYVRKIERVRMHSRNGESSQKGWVRKTPSVEYSLLCIEMGTLVLTACRAPRVAGSAWPNVACSFCSRTENSSCICPFVSSATWRSGYFSRFFAFSKLIWMEIVCLFFYFEICVSKMHTF